MRYECSICKKEVLPREIVKRIIENFPEDKQKMIDNECPDSDKHYSIIRKREVMALTKEQRQEVLDLFRQGNTIGEIMTLKNLSMDVVGEIITINIEQIHTLRKETI